jgi:predicted GIY-YIG superfamily endonuclease
MSATPRLGIVYLIHFARPYRHARHYTGWTGNLPRRLAEHATGEGARLLAVITDAGIGWTLARIWPNATRTYERCLKNQGGASRRCPLCRTTGALRAAVPAARLTPLLGIDPDTGLVRTRAVCETCGKTRGLFEFDLADPVSRTCLICQPRPARCGPLPRLRLRPAWDAEARAGDGAAF